MTNAHNNVIYCGATGDLFRRVVEHRNGIFLNSFTQRYNIRKLVYFESHSLVGDAFARENQVKAGSRKKKIALIVSMNPEWKDLFPMLSNAETDELRKIRNHFK